MILNFLGCAKIKSVIRINIATPHSVLSISSLFCRFRSWKVMYFGSDVFSLYNLKEIFRHKGPGKLVNHLEVVTIPHKKNPVREFAESSDIKVQDWPPDLKDSFDIGVVVSFGKLIPSEIINHFPLGMINVHASLLPKYRGGTPIIHSIMNGDTVTGITIMQIRAEKFDIGGIIKQKSLNVDNDELMPSVRDRLAKLGAECLIETLEALPDCLKTVKEQPKENISYAPRINSSVAIIEWNNMTASQIYNRHRALFSVYNLKTTFLEKPIKVLNFKLSIGKEDDDRICNSLPGSFDYLRKEKLLQVQCKDSHIYISDVIYNGKTLKATDFYGGYLQKLPRTEWRFA